MAKYQVRTKTLTLPRPNNLQPSLENTALKLMEEAGELAGAITRFKDAQQRARSRQQGLPGVAEDEELLAQRSAAARAIADELLDVAQTAVTMMFVLEEDFGVDLEEALEEHVSKLVCKGYIRLESN
jgi:NTP pyrophosphatase (non-canonical NTP hydrolase)